MRNLRFVAFLFLLFALMIFAVPPATFAQVGVGVGISVGTPPPELPVYAQPICPGPGYIWTPGYWAWADPGGYYWVPGTWVFPPRVGVLWTPGYWGWEGGRYFWHGGYWGPHVGFYGGINYGFGYVGVGFVGGRWDHGVFAYNRAYSNVNITVIHNTYENRVVVHDNHVSFNGGEGGIDRRPSADEERWSHEQHFQPTSRQVQHEGMARNDHSQWASENHGHPQFAASARPGEFHNAGNAGGNRNFNPPHNNNERGGQPAGHQNMNQPHNQPHDQPHNQTAEHNQGNQHQGNSGGGQHAGNGGGGGGQHGGNGGGGQHASNDQHKGGGGGEHKDAH